jgi:hypothetical protein
MAGSTEQARRIGNQQASKAIPNSISAAPQKAVALSGLTPKSSDANEPRECGRCKRAERHACAGHGEPVTQNMRGDIPPPCAQRNANADFPRTLRYRLRRDHGVDAERRQQQRKRGKGADEPEAEPPLGELISAREMKTSDMTR